MTHAHTIAILGGLTCLTGCSDSVSLVNLNEEQKSSIQELIDANELSLPIYTEITRRADVHISATKKDSLDAFNNDVRDAHEVVKKYLHEGRIFGFHDSQNKELTHASAFLYLAPLEKDQYIGVSLYQEEATGEVRVSIGGPSALLHEGCHAKMGDHSKAVNDARDLEQNGDMNKTAFSRIVRDKKDLCYFLTILGELSDNIYSVHNGDMNQLEVLTSYGEKIRNANNEKEKQVAQANFEYIYTSVEAAYILKDQETWARLTIDRALSNPDTEGEFKIWGITQKDLIDVYANEEKIYTEYHTEYEQAYQDFLEEYANELQEAKEKGRETSSERRAHLSRERGLRLY